MFDLDAFLHYLANAYLLQGVLITIGLTVFPLFAGLVLGILIALARGSGYRTLVWPARIYLWVFRGTPLLVQLVIIYTGLPQIGLRFGVVTSAFLALSLNEAAYLSEIVRAGFNGVPTGQRDAAQALGLSPAKALRLVIFPQAMRLILPPLGNSVNGMLKATSLTSVISMEELMRRAQILMQTKFEVLELYAVAAVWYLALTTLWDFVQGPLERRLSRGYAVTPVAAGENYLLRKDAT